MDYSEHPTILDSNVSHLKDYDEDLTFAQSINQYDGEISFQTSLEDENINSMAIDCALTQDITLMETDIQDDFNILATFIDLKTYYI